MRVRVAQRCLVRAAAVVVVIVAGAVVPAVARTGRGGPPVGDYDGATGQSSPSFTEFNHHGHVRLGVLAPVAAYRAGYRGCSNRCAHERIYLATFQALPRNCTYNGGPPPGPVPPIVASGFASFKRGYLGTRGVTTIGANETFTLSRLTGRVSGAAAVIHASVAGRFTGSRVAGTLTYSGYRLASPSNGATLACQGGTVNFSGRLTAG